MRIKKMSGLCLTKRRVYYDTKNERANDQKTGANSANLANSAKLANSANLADFAKTSKLSLNLAKSADRC